MDGKPPTKARFKATDGRYTLVSERTSGLIPFQGGRATRLTLAALRGGAEQGRYIVFNVSEQLLICAHDATDKVGGRARRGLSGRGLRHAHHARGRRAARVQRRGRWRADEPARARGAPRPRRTRSAHWCSTRHRCGTATRERTLTLNPGTGTTCWSAWPMARVSLSTLWPGGMHSTGTPPAGVLGGARRG